MTTGPSLRVTAVVVNWNAGRRLMDCVRSLLAPSDDVEVHVRVVDNASTDGSVADLVAELGGHPRVTVVHSAGNLGYGRGVNFGASQSETPFVMALNPDVVIAPDAIEKMARLMASRPDAGLVGPRLLDADGGVAPSVGEAPTLGGEICRKFLLHLMFPFAKFGRRSPESLVRVGWVTGACMLFRREAFCQVGGMDEAIFMYYEDVDLCIRLNKAGWGVYHLPEAVGRHQGQASSRQVLEQMLVTSAVSHRYLMEKHLGEGAARILVKLTPVEMLLRSAIWKVQSFGPPERRPEARARLSAYRRIPRVVAGMRPGEPALLASETGGRPE